MTRTGSELFNKSASYSPETFLADSFKQAQVSLLPWEADFSSLPQNPLFDTLNHQYLTLWEIQLRQRYDLCSLTSLKNVLLVFEAHSLMAIVLLPMN